MPEAIASQKHVYFFGAGQAEGGSELKHLVGGKGASLADMTKAGLNVPPGFTISTACCDYFLRHDGAWPEGLEHDVRCGLARLEALDSKRSSAGNSAVGPIRCSWPCAPGPQCQCPV